MESALLNLINFNWIVGVLYKICLFIDYLVYSVATWFFNAFYIIAKMGPDLGTEENVLEVIFQRIQLFIGIIALFTFIKTFINYIINPDKISSEGNKIILKVLVSIILLLTYNRIFDFLTDFQTSVINFDTIPKLILGPYESDESFENMGKTFTNNIFTVFFYCGDDYCDPNASEQFGLVKKGEADILSLSDYVRARGVHYEYPVLSTVVGIVLIYYFLDFAIAVGIRLFKLIILQIFAPIPILLYMVPTQKDYASNYLKTYITTYIELFLRLFIIFMVYVMASLLMDVVTGIFKSNSDNKNFIVPIILIFALFQFAKMFPDLISKIFELDSSSLKGSGLAGTLLKGGAAVLGGAAGLALGLGTGIASSAASGLGLGAGISHSLSSGFRGLNAGFSGARKGLGAFNENLRNASANSFTRANEIYKSGGSFRHGVGSLLNQVGYGEYDKIRGERLDKSLQKAIEKRGDAENAFNEVNSLKDRSRDLYAEALNENGNIAQYQQYMHDLSIMRSGGVGVTAADYRRALSNINRHDLDVASFYDSGKLSYSGRSLALSGSYCGTSYSSLSAIKSQAETDAGRYEDSTGTKATVANFSDISNAQRIVGTKVSETTKAVSDAKADVDNFKKGKAHKLVTRNVRD